MKSYDAIVIGTGIAGLSVGRELARLGELVLILERDVRGGNASRAAAGILDPYTEAEKNTPLFQLSLKAFQFYPQFLDGLGAGARKKIEFQKTGVLYLAFSAKDESVLKKRALWQERRGIPVKNLSAGQVQELEPVVSKTVRSGIFYPEIPKVNAHKLTTWIFEAARREGVEIRTGVKDAVVKIQKRKVRGVRANGNFLETGKVIVAAGSWSGPEKRFGVSVGVKPVRGQILMVRARPVFQPKHILHSLRYAYLIPWPSGRILVGSTLESAGFQSRVTRGGEKDILRRAGEIIEGIESFPVETSWAGLRPCPDRGRAFIGPTGIAGLFLATGYYRSGILIAPLVGKLLAEGIHSGNFSPLVIPFFVK